ncbi:MAG: ribosome biogenesis GTP-binding protein YihA/YsxC [Alphaproteobacteria bacterium]|nr:ribosome biogenesis GTP-binding protein YihA/YsxC [Alphaproteobacteria bacterium]
MPTTGQNPAGSPPAAADAEDAQRIEFGRWLFSQPCTFLRGVARLDSLAEPDLPEVAFAGRSNCGKSSLLNALTGRRSLARTSNTPGRTQQLNFFDLGGQLWLVDMPGYGYARASKTDIAAWTQTVRDYLRGRPTLRRLCVLIDARHGIKANDEEMMAMLDKAAVGYQIVLTKTDKLTPGALAARLAATEKTLKAHPAALPKPVATSARNGDGIEHLRAEIAMLAADSPDALQSART